jgi:hypothetical protein
MIFNIGSHTELLFCKFNFGPYRSTASAAASVAVAGGVIVVAAAAVWDCKFRKHKILNGDTFSVLIALQFVPVRFTTSKLIIQAAVIASCSVDRRQQLIKDFQKELSQGASLPFQGGAFLCVFIPPPACHHKFNRRFIGFELTRS